MEDCRRVLVLILIVCAGLISFSCSGKSPDQKPRSGTKIFFPGTEEEIKVHYIAGEEKGPTLLIFAGIHGDEKAGFLTAEKFTKIRLEKGALIVVPRLNAPAVVNGTRNGRNGDMNRLFHLTGEKPGIPDSRLVNVAQNLISQADYVLNLHQGDGFYSPNWVSRVRNPNKWGQCNVIDAPSFDLPNGERLELQAFAKRIAYKSNRRISDRRFHFQVNNTNTSQSKSRHKEQRRSLTYYALSKQHKIALGLEATRNCPLPRAVSYLAIAVNSVMDEIGIVTTNLPS